MSLLGEVTIIEKEINFRNSGWQILTFCESRFWKAVKTNVFTFSICLPRKPPESSSPVLK